MEYPLTLVYPLSQHYKYDKLYIIWIHVAFLLIWAYFHLNRKFDPCTKGQWPFLIRSFISTTQHGTDIMWLTFLAPYNERNNMTCTTTKLKHFEFPSAWGRSQFTPWAVQANYRIRYGTEYGTSVPDPVHSIRQCIRQTQIISNF